MATHDDAMLMMQILRWGEESGATEAAHRMMLEHPGGEPTDKDASDPDVFRMLMLGETMGTFTKQGLLDPGLVHDLWAVDWTWQVVGAAAKAQREQVGEPRLWENFEALASG
jgi:hypothetical protein